MLKYYFSLSSIIKYYYYLFRNILKIKAEEVNYCSLPTINGKLIIKNLGNISMGNKLLINSSYESNLVGLPFPTILHTQNKNAEIKIGSNVGISGSSIVAATSIIIGDNVIIGGGCGIWDTDFHPIDYRKRLEHQTKDAISKPIIIEDNVFIGARSIILKGVTIGSGAVVGAGTVVTKDVPSCSIVFGNPMNIKIQ
jgi:acetyltransferase-like isoleucine patch superfamily enzyme